MPINPLDNGEKDTLNNSNRSVRHFFYDHLYNSSTQVNWDKAQLIDDTYFDPTHYPQSFNITYKVETYDWNCTNTDPNDTEIFLNRDLSDKVVSVTYDCDGSSDIKTSAILTLYVPPDDEFWYMNREYDVKHVPSGAGGQRNTVWIPLIYYIEEQFEFKNDVPEVKAYPDSTYQGNKFVDYYKKTEKKCSRVLGYFIPESGDYTYNETTNQLTLQLQGLSRAFASDMGGGVFTPISSFDYYFDMPYNNSPTKILAYRIETKEESSTTNSTVQKPVPKTAEEKEKEFVRNDEERCYGAIPQIIKEKGVVFGTAPVVNQRNDGSNENKRLNVPLPLSISGEDDSGYFKLFWGFEIAQIIYDIAMCRTDAQLSRYHLPLVNYTVPSADCETTSKSLIFPTGWNFENGTSVMEIAKKILGDKYYEPMIWVDEDRRLCIETRATYPTDYREYIPYRNIRDLVIDESISMDDSEFYTVTEVYGKNGEYYGVYDGTFDAFKTVLGNTSVSIEGNMSASFLSQIPKTQVIRDESIESDEECYQRAIYETWKSSRGHTKITVKLRDNMIFNTYRMSHIVGESFVEYQTLQDGGKTILCNLEKASLSGGVWTWELTPFYSFAPVYDDLSSGFYKRWKTEHYDEWIGYKYNNEWLVPEYQEDINNDGVIDKKDLLTFQQKNTLAVPVILGWELIDGHILRLYISSADIGISVVKMWTAAGGGAVNYSKFIGESVNTNGTENLPWETSHATETAHLTDGKHIYKVFDYPVKQNGRYTFICGLYNPYHEQSTSSPYYIDVTGVCVPETKIPDNESGSAITIPSHKPYLTDEYGNKLTDENNNRLTI